MLFDPEHLSFSLVLPSRWKTTSALQVWTEIQIALLGLWPRPELLVDAKNIEEYIQWANTVGVRALALLIQQSMVRYERRKKCERPGKGALGVLSGGRPRFFTFNLGPSRP